MCRKRVELKQKRNKYMVTTLDNQEGYSTTRPHLVHLCNLQFSYILSTFTVQNKDKEVFGVF